MGQEGEAEDPLVFFESSCVRRRRDRMAVRVWLAQVADREVYVKHIRGPKNRPASEVGLIDRLKWGLGGSRALRVWRVHLAMTKAGLDVPKVLLAARRRGATGAEDLLVTEAVHEPPLKQVLQQADAPERTAALARAGEALAAMHRAGFVHGDPILANLLMSEKGGVVWLDNDRTRWLGLPPRIMRLRNVASLTCRALVYCPWREVRGMLEMYRRVMELDPRRWRRELHRVVAVVRRWESRGKRKRLRHG